MKIKRTIAFLLVICMSFCLFGCDFVGTNDELVAPPELTGDMYPIGKALEKSAGSRYNLKYPTAGDRRSAIVLEDIDGDGIFEAIAFYSTSDDEMSNMHINVIRQNDGEWESVFDQTIIAVGVEMVDFCDLDGNGTMEVLVGWQVNGNSEKQLSVFSFENGELKQQLSQPYTNFLCCDLDSNGENEIFVHLLNTSEQQNRAIIYSFTDEGTIAQTAGCLMDSGVKTAQSPVQSVLSNGQKAIYIDEIKGVGSVTEVLFFSRGELVNPLLDTENSVENTLTLRAASLETQDINQDGTLEIPVATELPNAKDDEILYYTNWCSFNGETLAVKLITVVNTVDGYYLDMPNSLVGKIAVLKDIDNHKREFYYYDAETATVGQMLFSITAMSADDWEEKKQENKSLTEITRNGNTVFVVTMGTENSVITIEKIKEIFKLVQWGMQ